MTVTNDAQDVFEPKLNDALAEEIRMRLAARRLTNRSLAQALHLSHGQVTQRLKGTVEWKINDIVVAAGLLNTTAEELVRQAQDALTFISLGNGNPWTRTGPQSWFDVWADVKGWPNDENPRRQTPGGGSFFVRPEGSVRLQGFEPRTFWFVVAGRAIGARGAVLFDRIVRRVSPARRNRATALAFHTASPEFPRLVAVPETPAARIPAGHHPSCPASYDNGACVGCGRHLSVVA